MTFHAKRYTKEEDKLIMTFRGTSKQLAAIFGVSTKTIQARKCSLKEKQREAAVAMYSRDTPIVGPTFSRPSWFNEDIVALAMARRG